MENNHNPLRLCSSTSSRSSTQSSSASELTNNNNNNNNNCSYSLELNSHSLPLNSIPFHSPEKKTKPRRFVSRPLQRNQACSTCRSRKVRCDAHKPACGACKRSAAAHGEDPNIVVCQYEPENHPYEDAGLDLPDDISNPSIQKPSPKVISLEQKIAEIENLISQLDLSLESQQSFSSEPACPSIAPGSSFLYPFPNTNEVIWSNWPTCLPPRRIISHLVKLYFSFQSGAGQIMFTEPARLLTNLHLPPNHPDFPFIGLLHAIMALAYRQSAAGDPDQFALNLLRVCNIKRYWPMESSVHLYHADRAKLLIEQAIYDATHLFQVTQALNIYCYYAYETVQLVPAWVCSGLAIRFSTPLGLNQLEICSEHLKGSKIKPKSLLPEPCTVLEKYERAVSFWLAFQMDRFLSVSAGRPHSISESDITSLLPAKPGTSQSTIGIVDLLSNPLSLSHPHFFSHHPYDVDVFQLELKATVLLGRVSDWLIRAPDPVGFNLRKYWQVPDGPIPDLRFQGDFVKLDQDINTFQMSLAPQFYSTIFEGDARKISHSKVMIILILNLSIILLHECFITKEQSDTSFKRCLQATIKIKCVGDLLFGAGYDTRLLHPFTNYCWAVAIRMMMRQLVQNEIKLIELATASPTCTQTSSTSWIHHSLPPLDPQYATSEDETNQELVQLLKIEQAKVDQNLIEIESLLRFNSNNQVQQADSESNPNVINHANFEPPHQPQQPNANVQHHDSSVRLEGGHENMWNNLIGDFSAGVDGLHQLGSVDSGNRRFDLVDGQHYDHASQAFDRPGPDRNNCAARIQHPDLSQLNLDHQSSTGILPQQDGGHHAHLMNNYQEDPSAYQAKLNFYPDQPRDRIKGLSQIYFDQLIKLFHVRFQAFRLPQSLSRVVLS